MKKPTILLVFLTLAGFVYAGQKESVNSIEMPSIKTELKSGAGREVAERFCIICHSLDYITTQPKFTRVQWTAVVNKMIKVMGAPIPEGDAKTIEDYLALQYGTGS